jgi:tRNA threonylcarbamoyladenosine biosynthesis protein TsaB
MNILAVDTALGACSVAVLDGEEVRAHRFVPMDRGHAEALAPMVEDALHASSLSFDAFDRLAVTTGPGTFTGQRVGLAFMRGLRLALKRPLAGIVTLDAMAAAARAEAKTSHAAVLHDAKRGEVYLAMSGEAGEIIPLQLARFDDAVAAIEDATRGMRDVPIAFAGTAGEAAARRHSELGGVAILAPILQPDAIWVARLAARLPEPASVPRPLYLRAPDAKLPANRTIFPVTLRPAVIPDCLVLAALHAGSFHDAWSTEYFASLLGSPGAFAIVAEAAAGPTGFILVRAAADEAEILSIGVSIGRRRGGVGRRLVAAAAERARQIGAHALFLEVSAANEAARALYASLGFREVGRRPGYYREGPPPAQDALVLKTDLPSPRLGNDPHLD